MRGLQAGVYLRKILIANRGEIACRVIKTAKRLGVKTVAVYSDADNKAMHVSMADEAYNIGRPAAQESYLRGEKILEVAKRAGAQAVHPGYGFLSENVEFATLCREKGIIFIGPPPSAIRDMGIKSTSKSIMSAAGVPVIPGYHGEDQSEPKLVEEAKKIGFPLMIKAVRGGGGKGMRIVHSESEFLSALESARRESLRSFGNDDVLLERYVSRPRHIEVQVFGDSHGNYVHLFERDCSIQRRHQKIIEQAPAPGVSPELQESLGEAGVKAARAVNYVGAGTVEFIFDTQTNKFYFMEMNTRLQVEHPVTEMVTGLDLVEWQLRVASGEELPLKQSEISLNGHAVEARIYAEDVTKGFIPTAGRLEALHIPQTSDKDIRVETGVTGGDEVSVHYDPMVAKLVVWHPDEKGALNKMESALSDFNIVGVTNNVNFLRVLCKNKDLQEGNVHTGFIEEHSHVIELPTPPQEIILQAAIGVLMKDMGADLASSLGLTLPFRINICHQRILKLKSGDKEIKVDVIFEPNGLLSISIDGGERVRARGSHTLTDNGFTNLRVETDSYVKKSRLHLSSNAVCVFDESGEFEFELEDQKKWSEGETSADLKNQALSPMPGVIEKVFVQPGSEVKKGDPLAVVMAMKMEYVVRASEDGRVKSVLFSAGQSVGKNAPLVAFES